MKYAQKAAKQIMKNFFTLVGEGGAVEQRKEIAGVLYITISHLKKPTKQTMQYYMTT